MFIKMFLKAIYPRLDLGEFHVNMLTFKMLKIVKKEKVRNSDIAKLKFANH